MIELKLSDLSLEKVYLKSIQSNGLLRYYTSVNAYREKRKPKLMYVKKSLFDNLVKDRMYRVSILDFSVPRICYLKKLKDEVVSLNLFQETRKVYCGGGLKTLTHEEFAEKVNAFCKGNESSFTKLESVLKEAFNNQKLYTDGDYIFDLSESRINDSDIKKENGKYISLNDDASLLLGGFKGLPFDIDVDSEEEIAVEHRFKRRYVMVYSANDPSGKNIHVYFPSFSEKFVTQDAFIQNQKENFVNLRFMTSFVRKNSKLFDYQDMELLDIEETILDLGVLSLNEIEDYQYDYYVYSHEFTPIFAWLARLLFKSTTISQISAIKRVIKPLLGGEKNKKFKTQFLDNVFTTSYSKLKTVKEGESIPEKLDISEYLNIEKHTNYHLKLKIQEELNLLKDKDLEKDIQHYYDQEIIE